jgi:mannan endo-1,4-beta-mannosidase
MFGWSEFESLSGAPDSEEWNKKYGTYIDFFLASMKELEQKNGKRLVHSLDLHWYPEMRGTQRITENDSSHKTIAARLEAPRSFWDPTFKEPSWIGDKLGKPIRLFPWLKEVIAKRYPGTQLAMTEYNFGTGGHVSGGLAQVDVLGIFGREGLVIANYWGNGAGVGELPEYIQSAFKLYRNYDGKGGKFGDTAVEATSADLTKGVVYAATDSKTKQLTVVVINKDLTNNTLAKVKLGQNYKAARGYQFDATSSAVRALPRVELKGTQIEQRVPRLSATIFVLDPA